MLPPSIHVRDMSEEDAKVWIIDAIRGKHSDCRHHGYDEETVLRLEIENMRLFEKYKHLTFEPTEYTSHFDTYRCTFETTVLSGTGILDIGAGESGPLLCGQNTQMFQPPRMVIDPCPNLMSHIPTGWNGLCETGLNAIKHFGKNSFDHVQSLETLEHMTQKEAHQLAQDMYDMSRKTGLLTSAGLCVHLGPQTVAFLDRNPTMMYHGQPNIEVLMEIGYTVRLKTGYGIGYGCQIHAFFDKSRTFEVPTA